MYRHEIQIVVACSEPGQERRVLYVDGQLAAVEEGPSTVDMTKPWAEQEEQMEIVREFFENAL